MPITKGVGESIVSGTLNQSGSFIMRAGKVGRDTLLAQIVQMVAAAQRSRAPIQRLVDRISSWFVPLGDRNRNGRFCGMVDLRTRAAVRLRPRRCRERTHHRLSLRVGPRHSHVDHGGSGPRGTRGRSRQKCRSAREDGKGRYFSDRQDRNPDRRQAESRCCGTGRGLFGGRRCSVCCGRRTVERASAGKGRSCSRRPA